MFAGKHQIFPVTLVDRLQDLIKAAKAHFHSKGEHSSLGIQTPLRLSQVLPAVGNGQEPLQVDRDGCPIESLSDPLLLGDHSLQGIWCFK